MSDVFEVSCVSKDDRASQHERITHIGGKQNGGWRVTQFDAIHQIETGQWGFYVNINGSRVALIVSVSASGNKYLKTNIDGMQPDNLLSLPECPRWE